MVAKRCIFKNSIVSLSSVEDKETHRAVGDVQCSTMVEEHAHMRPTDTQQLDSQPSNALSVAGEERCICNVISKIYNTLLMPCSPETAAVLIPQTPPSRHLDNEPILKATSQQHDQDVSEKEQVKIDKCFPEAGTALALPITAPVPSTRDSAPRQSPDELRPPSKTAFRRAPLTEGEGGQLEQAVVFI